MDYGTVSQLTALEPPLVKRSQVQGEEKEAEFLSLRLLNKRGRVRLSPKAIEYSRLPGKSSLLAVGNQKGYLAAAVYNGGGSHILISTLSELRTAIESGQPEPEPFIPFSSQRSLLEVPGTPSIIKFAFNDERLIVGVLEGPILVYNTSDVFAPSRIQLDPIYSLPGDTSTIPRDILPNPGESPELVAILREVHGQEPGHQVDVVDVQQLRHISGWRKGNDPALTPVSISWSPKGKQIAIGLQSGDMLLYNPLSPENPKSHLPRPPSIPANASSLLATTWLSNPTFHTIFSSPEASSSMFDASMSSSLTKTHVISTHDAKSQSAIDVELQDPSPPFGAQFTPGPLSIVLRNWSPTKFIIICGDGPSPDIGVIGSLSVEGEDAWVNFTLEETSTPSLPLGEDTQDMALLGLEVDLTSTKSVRISEQPDDGTPDLPPSPILYAYMSDGTVVAWHVLNTDGNPYPGMITSATEATISSIPSATQPKAGVEISPHMSSASFGSQFRKVEAPASATAQPAPAFGQAVSSPSPSVAPAQGFGAFGNVNTTSKFGSTGFGFGSGSTPSPFGKPSTPPTFGSSGFGAGEETKAPPVSSTFGSTSHGSAPIAPAFGTSGFGSKPTVPAFGQSGFSASPFGSSKPAVGSAGGGFAAFANKGTSAFSAPTSSSSPESKPAQLPLFKQGGFGQSTPAFQSAFGTGSSGQVSTLPASAFGAGGSGPAISSGQETQTTQPAFQTFGTKAVSPAFGQSGFGGATTKMSQTGVFGGFGALGDSLKSATPSAPTRAGSFPGSPPGSPPRSPPSPGDSPPGSPVLRSTSQLPKPASSYVKPAEGFGAFVKPTGAFTAPSSVVKPAEGFGAFSQQQPAASAFGQSRPAAPTFGSTAFGSPPKPGGTTAPIFGSTSALVGSRKPVFGTSSLGAAPQAKVSEPSKPITGGFGAYSASGGGFASFANAGKPATFDAILSSGDLGKKKSTETPPAFDSASAPKASDASSTEREVSSTPTAEILLGEAKPVDKGSLPEEPLRDADSVSSLLSLKDATSHAGRSLASKTPTVSPTEVQNPSEEPESEATGPEDVEQTSSDAFSLTDNELDDSGSEGAEQPSRSPTRSISEDEWNEPENIPLPETPTPRSTPTSLPASPKLPTVNLSTSSAKPHSAVSNMGNTNASTTPPGSPDKSAVSTPAPLAPKPVPPPTGPSFALGLGRPSSRPIRSSPLASAPITSTDHEDAITPSKSAPAAVDVESTTPKVPLGQFPSTVQLPTVGQLGDSANDPSTAANASRRPKTPPLLSTSLNPPASPAPSKSPPILGQQPQPHLVPQEASRAPAPSSVPIPTSAASASKGTDVKTEELPTHPMQTEFLRAYQEMSKELAQLFNKAQEMRLIRPIIKEPRGLNKLVLNNEDFVPGKYSLGDLSSFTTMIGTLQKRVVPLLEQGKADKGLLQDLQNLALITETKQEELARWVRAREDPEFSKTLKPHALGPEHSENQIRLRKALQSVHDRLQQCEDEVESLKKRLEQHKSGRAGLRPPSLDTIDRTCRNIRIALEERTKLLEELDSRISALSPRATESLRGGYPGVPTPSLGSTTPPFASVAAAALNSERSALRLKNALLSARKEPLFTTNVLKRESKGSAASETLSTSQPLRPEWKLPPVPPLNTSSSSVNRRTARTGKRHGAVPLKSSSPSGDTKPVAFDWGPLPGVAPMNKLSLDVRSQKRRDSHLPVEQKQDDKQWDEVAED